MHFVISHDCVVNATVASLCTLKHASTCTLDHMQSQHSCRGIDDTVGDLEAQPVVADMAFTAHIAHAAGYTRKRKHGTACPATVSAAAQALK